MVSGSVCAGIFCDGNTSLFDDSVDVVRLEAQLPDADSMQPICVQLVEDACVWCSR